MFSDGQCTNRRQLSITSLPATISRSSNAVKESSRMDMSSDVVSTFCSPGIKSSSNRTNCRLFNCRMDLVKTAERKTSHPACADCSDIDCSGSNANESLLFSDLSFITKSEHIDDLFDLGSRSIDCIESQYRCVKTEPGMSYDEMHAPVQSKLVKETFKGKTLTCLLKDGERYVLLETIHLVFCSDFQLWQFVFAVETMCSFPVIVLSGEEEQMFIDRYKLPAKHLRVAKALSLSVFCRNFDSIASSLKMMFKKDNDLADLSVDAFLKEVSLLSELDVNPVGHDVSQSCTAQPLAGSRDVISGSQDRGPHESVVTCVASTTVPSESCTVSRTTRSSGAPSLQSCAPSRATRNSSSSRYLNVAKRSRRRVNSSCISTASVVLLKPQPNSNNHTSELTPVVIETVDIGGTQLLCVRRCTNLIATLEIIRHSVFTECPLDVLMWNVSRLKLKVFSATEAEMTELRKLCPSVVEYSFRCCVDVDEFRLNHARLRDAVQSELALSAHSLHSELLNDLCASLAAIQL